MYADSWCSHWITELPCNYWGSLFTWIEVVVVSGYAGEPNCGQMLYSGRQSYCILLGTDLQFVEVDMFNLLEASLCLQMEAWFGLWLLLRHIIFLKWCQSNNKQCSLGVGLSSFASGALYFSPNSLLTVKLRLLLLSKGLHPVDRGFPAWFWPCVRCQLCLPSFPILCPTLAWDGWISRFGFQIPLPVMFGAYAAVMVKKCVSLWGTVCLREHVSWGFEMAFFMLASCTIVKINKHQCTSN